MLEKTLETSLDCKEIQPVHPKEISPEYSLEGLMLKLKLQYFGHLMQRIDAFELWYLEKTLECSLNCKETQPINREGNQSGIFFGRTDVEAETPMLWPPDVN